jgi:hypothetical protein
MTLINSRSCKRLKTDVDLCIVWQPSKERKPFDFVLGSLYKFQSWRCLSFWVRFWKCSRILKLWVLLDHPECNLKAYLKHPLNILHAYMKHTWSVLSAFVCIFLWILLKQHEAFYIHWWFGIENHMTFCIHHCNILVKLLMYH